MTTRSDSVREGARDSAPVFPAHNPSGETSSTQPNREGSRVETTAAGFQLVQQWHSQPRKLRIIHVGAGATGLCAAF
jgi:hypothetical protein